MKRVFSLLVVVVFLFTASCATIPEEHKGAATGAGIGAATGAVIGGLAGGTKGAVIGGLLGVLAGGAVGHYAYDKKKTQVQTNKDYGYTGSGAQVRIESAQASPTKVKPGDKVDLNCTYAVLTNSNEAVNVREAREIYYGDSLWGNPEVREDRQGGTYQSGIPIVLPGDAKKGTYKVRFIMEAGSSKDVRETSFTVQ
jgi:hypothetical protein